VTQRNLTAVFRTHVSLQLTYGGLVLPAALKLHDWTQWRKSG